MKKMVPNMVSHFVLLAGIGITIGFWIVAAGIPQAPYKDDVAGVLPIRLKPKEGLLFRRALDGVFVSTESAANQMPYAVMIGNSWDSRPIVGIELASVVFEAPVEAGITRLLALYDHATVFKELGSVRSARSYFVDWAAGHHAAYMHAGGSPSALQKLRRQQNVLDIDELRGDSRYFWRSKERKAPHNLFTSSDLLNAKRAATDGIAQSFHFSPIGPWDFKDDDAFQNRPLDAPILYVPFSTSRYDVTFQYDRLRNAYMRSVGGESDVTASGARVAVKNVVVISMEVGLEDREHLTMETIGSGDALICLDGKCDVGKWEKKDGSSRIQFFQSNTGKTEHVPVRLNAGMTWILAVQKNQFSKVTQKEL